MRELKIGETVKAGTVFIVTTGEYSSYGVIGIFRAIADFVVPAGVCRREPPCLVPFPDVNAVTTNPAWCEELDGVELHDVHDE